MANISTELAAILSAIYGKDVRDSIYNAIDKMNISLEDAIDNQLLRIDSTLTENGQAADSSVVGERIQAVEETINTSVTTLMADAITYKGDLPNNTNFNSVITNGIYNIVSTNTHANKPEDGGIYGLLIVLGGNPGYLKQIYISLNASGTDLPMYTRASLKSGVSATKWSKWKSSLDTELRNQVSTLEGNAFKYKGTLSNNTNFNSVTANGLYNVPGSNNYLNKPHDSGTYGLLVVLGGNPGYLKQIYISLSGVGSDLPMYSRGTLLSGIAVTDWSEWKSSVDTELRETVSVLRDDLNTLNDGGLNIKDEVITQGINEWLDEHPEATTTVQDGSITRAKIEAALRKNINYIYETSDDMIADENLVSGMSACVLGDSSRHDNKSRFYYISSTLDRTKSHKDLDNGNYAYLIYDQIELSGDKLITNGSAAATIMANTANSYTRYTSGDGASTPYTSDEFYYGPDDNWQFDIQPSKQDGKFAIRCSAFIKDLIYGVTYENSKYLNDDNKYDPNMCIDFDVSMVNDTENYDTRFVAEYVYNNGYAFYPNKEFSNIKTGDLLFIDGGGVNNPHRDRFKGVTHSAVFAYNINDNYSCVWEVGTLPVLQRRPKSYFENYLVFCARLPFNNVESVPLVNLIKRNAEETITAEQTLITIATSKTLEAHKQYTLVANIDIGDNDINSYFPSVKDGSNTLSLTYRGALNPPTNNIYIIPFVPVEDTSSISIYMGKASSSYVQNLVTLRWYNVFEGLVLNCDKYVEVADSYFMLNVGERIRANDDLNNYLSPGNYYMTATDTNSIANVPRTGVSLNLKIIRLNLTERYHQICFADTTNADVYIRRINVYNGANIFGTWKHLLTE